MGGQTRLIFVRNIQRALTARHAGGIVGITGSIVAGVTCLVVGFVTALPSIRLIVLERQGKCDYVPCAFDHTYLAAGLSASVALAGVGLLAGLFAFIKRKI